MLYPSLPSEQPPPSLLKAISIPTTTARSLLTKVDARKVDLDPVYGARTAVSLLMPPLNTLETSALRYVVVAYRGVVVEHMRIDGATTKIWRPWLSSSSIGVLGDFLPLCYRRQCHRRDCPKYIPPSPDLSDQHHPRTLSAQAKETGGFSSPLNHTWQFDCGQSTASWP